MASRPADADDAAGLLAQFHDRRTLTLPQVEVVLADDTVDLSPEFLHALEHLDDHGWSSTLVDLLRSARPLPDDFVTRLAGSRVVYTLAVIASPRPVPDSVFDVVTRLSWQFRDLPVKAVRSSHPIPDRYLIDWVEDYDAAVALIESPRTIPDAAYETMLAHRYRARRYRTLPEELASSGRTFPDDVVYALVTDETTVDAYLKSASPLIPEYARHFAVHPNQRRRWHLAMSPRRLPADVLLQLAADPDRDVRAALAGSTSPVPRRVLDMLAADSDPRVRADVASSDRVLPDPVIAVLSKDLDPWVRARLARSERPLPARAAARLAADPEPQVTEPFAENDRPLPERLVRVLAVNPDPGTRSALIRSGRPLPDDVITAFAVDPDPGVRAALAASAYPVPLPTLLTLARDPNRDVVDALAGCDRPPQERFRAYLPPEQTRSVPLPVPVLIELAQRADVERQIVTVVGATRSRWNTVLTDPATPDHIRTLIAALTRQPRTLTDAVGSSDPAVRSAAAANNKIKPVDVDLLARDPNPMVRAAAAASPALPLTTLHDLARDDDPTVRAATLTSDRCSDVILTLLSDDPDPGVRDAAQHRLLAAALT